MLFRIKLLIATFLLLRRLVSLFAFAQKSMPWTNSGTGDGTSGGYTALEWSELHRQILMAGQEASAGVMRGVGSELAVSGSSSPLTVGTGAAIVYGKWYYNDAATTSNLSVATPTVGTTGGHVILELDWTAQTVRAKAVRNTDGNSAIPSLTQSTSTQWQIRLATFTITTGGAMTLTDARDFLSIGAPAIGGRQSNSATDWGTAGTTNYADPNGKILVGTTQWAGSSASSGSVTVTFPDGGFSGKPIILVGVKSTADPSAQGFRVFADNPLNNTSFTIYWNSTTSIVVLNLYWMAIGPR